MLLTLSKSIFFTFFRNELKSVEHSNSFATRRNNVEIIKKKEFKDYSEDVAMKKFLEFFDQLDEELAKLLFRRRTKA